MIVCGGWGLVCQWAVLIRQLVPWSFKSRHSLSNCSRTWNAVERGVLDRSLLMMTVPPSLLFCK